MTSSPLPPSTPRHHLWTWLWRATVLLLFALCYALPLAVLREHGPVAALIATLAIVPLWVFLAGRRESFLSLVLLWLLCLTLPVAVRSAASATAGPWGAIVGLVAALAAMVLQVRLAGRSVAALLPGCLTMSVVLGNAILVLRDVIALVRGRWI